ncbi:MULTISPECIES: TolC family protein [unclassified Acinetobacter]|uniref:TolC family protein n=1 Tax=unclassified Acinetobacter TaxID=196816 RepID=UPI0015D36A2E|nr:MULTISPECIES: TolC family protein [unclassified Acinetobacter]UUS59076.1 TolC family protein [Acinetobacter sp. YH16040_T]
MSLYFTAFIRLGLAVGISTALQSTFAENVSSFESAFAKVQNYQAQTDIWQQQQQISDFNLRQSKLWQNPSLSIEQNGFGKNQDQELSIAISQPLDVFGQRKINQALASTSAQQIQLQQQIWNAQSQLIVKYAWSQLAIAQNEQSIYATQLKLSKSNLDSAQKRYQAGSIALVDVERAQIEALEIQRLYQQAFLKQQTVARQLSNLWGETTSQIGLNNSVTPWPEQSQSLVERNLSEGWLQKLYALNVQQANQQIEHLKVQARPNPTLNMGMSRTKSPTDTNDTVLVLGVDIPLNIFNRQQYAIPMAQKQQILLNHQQQRELKQQVLDIANSIHQLKGLRTQFDATGSQIGLAEKVQNRTLQGFQAGKFAITDVQQTTKQLQDLRLSQIQILAQAWQSALSAEALSIGTSYEEISRSDAYSQLNKKAIEASQNLINSASAQ